MQRRAVIDSLLNAVADESDFGDSASTFLEIGGNVKSNDRKDNAACNPAIVKTKTF